MRSRRIVVAALAMLAALSMMLPCARSWSNGGYSSDPDNPDYGTHDWIAEAALTLQDKDVTFLTTTYSSLFLLGTEAPDNPDYIGDTSKHHVYFHSDGTLQDDASALRASQMYAIALGFLKQGDEESAAYDIGVMSHYISDVGVFGHTMGAYTDWGAEVHHSDYESAMESMKGSFSLPGGHDLGDSTAYDATLRLARSVTFGSGSIEPNVWMDAHYDFADATFKASAFASLYASVDAVASAINHLMVAAEPAPTPTPNPPPEQEPVVTPQAPEAPSGLTAKVEAGRIRLSWVAPYGDGGANITQYLVFRSSSADTSGGTLVATLSASTLSWTDASAQKGTAYEYRVAAVNSVGQSELSLSVTAEVPAGAGSLLLAGVLALVGCGTAAGGVLVLRARKSARRR